MLKKNKFIISLLVFSMLLAAFGCSTKSKNIGKPQTVPRRVTTNTTHQGVPQGMVTTTPPATTVTVTSAPPSQLTSLENSAITVISESKSKKWKSADKKVKSIKTEFKKVNPKLITAGVPASTINNISLSLDNLAKNVTAKKSYEAQINANDITNYVADAMGYYKVTVPKDFTKLDYYLRDVEINLQNKDWAKIGEDLGFIKSTWQSSSALMSGSDKNIKKMNTELNLLQTAVSKKQAKSTLNYAKKTMVITKSIEHGFGKKVKK